MCGSFDLGGFLLWRWCLGFCVLFLCFFCFGLFCFWGRGGGGWLEGSGGGWGSWSTCLLGFCKIQYQWWCRGRLVGQNWRGLKIVMFIWSFHLIQMKRNFKEFCFHEERYKNILSPAKMISNRFQPNKRNL